MRNQVFLFVPKSTTADSDRGLVLQLEAPQWLHTLVQILAWCKRKLAHIHPIWPLFNAFDSTTATVMRRWNALISVEDLLIEPTSYERDRRCSRSLSGVLHLMNMLRYVIRPSIRLLHLLIVNVQMPTLRRVISFQITSSTLDSRRLLNSFCTFLQDSFSHEWAVSFPTCSNVV